MKMAEDACYWMAARQAFEAPVMADRQAYSPPVPPTAESKDDGIVDVLNASEQLVAGVRRFAAMVVECQKNVRTKVGDLESHWLGRGLDASAAENKRRR